MLTNEDNFCPFCGQENVDQRVTIIRFLKDFVSNYLNFETVFFQTLPVFLFHPGKLTSTFNEGKRRKYIHPIRLYLITSLFYFFIVSLVIPADLVDRIMSGEITSEGIEKDSQGLMKINSRASETFDSLKKTGQLDEIKNLGINLDSMQLNAENLENIDQLAQDSIKSSQNLWKRLRAMSIDPEVSDSAFSEALSQTSFNVSIGLDVPQKRKFVANSSLFISSAAQNLPLMMFLLLPFFAFLLWLLNIRSKKYYVEHLIHGLHIHSFAYVLYGLAILWMSKLQIAIPLTFLLAFIGVSTYTYLSMLNVSKQGWFVTLIKFWVLGLFYFTGLAFAMIFELYISLKTF
ncbi:DUF3667 domain-containing protein [Algoriphagus lutimaris]|uniref:DUF3667 domain-containing protein n=1 Tax=Algoriphagus lutimaris TaxID=613197 RepID=UPI00196B0B51|nr:DUF3667 domain-containing protein [Algoriphagus lutimaris]MBN3519989.1 DUF3667 domain-containing protein [Algoriphagus lutimaris]